jgi:microcystin-dependent protein
MSGSRYTTPYAYVSDGNGDPIVGAQLSFYETGTSTPQNTYSDVNLTIPNPNPVPSGTDGLFPSIFLLAAPSYKVVLADENDVLIWTADPVGPGASAAASVPSYLYGMIFAWAGPTPPSGAVFCFGQAVSRIAYPSLFALIGTFWGIGDGATTFNLPDLRGNTLAGVDNMGGAAADRLTAAALGTGAVLGVVAGNQLAQAHSHGITDPGHFHVLNLGTNEVAGGGNPIQAPGSGTSVDVQTNTTGITITSALSGNSQNVQPTAVVNYIMFLA